MGVLLAMGVAGAAIAAGLWTDRITEFELANGMRALGAEFRAGREERPAVGTGPIERRGTFLAEFRAWPVIVLAAGAPHASAPISDSARSSQMGMSISLYIVLAVARCLRAPSRSTVCSDSLPRPT